MKVMYFSHAWTNVQTVQYFYTHLLRDFSMKCLSYTGKWSVLTMRWQINLSVTVQVKKIIAICFVKELKHFLMQVFNADVVNYIVSFVGKNLITQLHVMMS